MPILSHVLIEARKAGQLIVSATDLDLAGVEVRRERSR